MSVDFVAQPADAFRLGDFLKNGLGDPAWTEFRAAVAFVKRSGTKHIRGGLEAFRLRGASVRISVGVDAGGTSVEGLADLIDALASTGRAYVFRNGGTPTFHPKVYLFKNDTAAELMIGSGNLTEGGLYTNYEAGVRLRLDLANRSDLDFLNLVCATLDGWSTPKEGLCYELDHPLLARLESEGLVREEANTWGDESKFESDSAVAEPKLFAYHGVQAAPPTTRDAADVGEGAQDGTATSEDTFQIATPPPVEAQSGEYTAFVMTLQNTDVGVGQTTKGTSRRSPEIFIPLSARDHDPEFWGWPDLFEPDDNWTGPVDGEGRGKLDRPGVMVRLGGVTFPVHFWYNPDKRDLRIRSEHMRSAGSIGDMLYIERSDGSGGFSYYVDIVPQGSPRHSDLLAKCEYKVRNSKKVFGYI